MPEFIQTVCGKCRRGYYVIPGDSTCPYCSHNPHEKNIMRGIVIFVTVAFTAYLAALVVFP